MKTRKLNISLESVKVYQSGHTKCFFYRAKLKVVDSKGVSSFIDMEGGNSFLTEKEAAQAAWKDLESMFSREYNPDH